MADEFHRHKESKPRLPIDSDHPMVRGAITVLEEQGGGPLPSVAIFRRGVELGVFAPYQYNSLRARLSQHCDLDDATVVRALGSKVGVRGSRTTAWVLADTGLGVQQVPANGGLIVGRARISAARRRALTRERAVREAGKARNLILDDDTLTGAPESARLVAGRTVREALLSALPLDAVQWILETLPLEAEFKSRLEAVADSLTARTVLIANEERKTA